jgi:hypothetical protein
MGDSNNVSAMLQSLWLGKSNNIDSCLRRLKLRNQRHTWLSLRNHWGSMLLADDKLMCNTLTLCFGQFRFQSGRFLSLLL